MRLYLKAESRNKVGYVPDWIKVSYKEEGKELELTLDIRGEIDYDKNMLNCRCKGDLVPWTLYDLNTGEEKKLSELNEEELQKLFPISKIANIIHIGTEFRVGLFPESDYENKFELAEKDILSSCEGCCDISYSSKGNNVSYSKTFAFEVEMNF